ncbi:excinuclease ABC subunit UvrA [Thauera sp. 2A1]|uniref:excinuclease ABC subunit UvrA n=1 Tax=Thauera sp. 2A1 TaxID=2570191 RepID=UPI00129173ED|nr:excinuclease ABC subunit UvrA [Thauera sp. 2A1]KAI5915689.1 excinuclease ABC subunit UvrA [Thauera sp. 2A1]
MSASDTRYTRIDAPASIADAIRIRGARQNNLRNLSLDLPLNRLTVVTGVSGSGKSSLVFDTLYAEGQRRYVETFSPYARQFLDRMDKPQVDRIEGVPPAIAIDQTNPVRTSRSTVGTMTELADHFKLLYARAAHLHCRCCGKPVRRDSAVSIAADLRARAAAEDDPRLVVCFPVTVPSNFSEAEVTGLLNAQGYTRIQERIAAGGAEGNDVLQVVQDRFRASNAEDARLAEALEAALHRGHGRLSVYASGEGVKAEKTPGEAVWRYSSGLHCADCDIHYSEATPGLFSFNSPIGACETCRGFGRVIGVDFGLVIPDESKTLAEGAVKPWQTESYRECQADLEKMAKKYGVAMDIPVRDLPPEHRHWLFEGDAKWKNWDSSWPRYWYGVRHFFDWLESKAYKMHIRVLLSRYRSYTECPACHGARLKPDALLWRLPMSSVGRASARQPCGQSGGLKPALREAPAGLAIHELMALPVDRIREAVAALHIPGVPDEATELVLGEIRSRLNYLADVGLGYLTLDRQSRTLSGGEVQRINLTTALGTSLVNTLFVLDEPSIGLHPRDIGRILGVMTRLRDAGNTLVVVEHDPQVMVAADELLEIGPGPGERGGNIVARGTPAEIAANPDSVTGPWLAGKKRIDVDRPPRPVDAATPRLKLVGARQHNLRDLTVGFPLQRLTCLTGVSGSGKSTLIQDVLYPALAKHFGEATESPGIFDSLENVDNLRGVVMVDQSPIGKSSRSNPVSYVGAWDPIRNLFAALPEAKQRGYTPGTFSFNAGTGRCPTCTGSGFEHVEMQFLSDVWLRCPDCEGKRYRPEILELQWDGRSVADVLELTVHEALDVFREHPKVLAALAPLADVGLDYLRLGQPVPTLSGGEAQRLKLAGHLAEAAQKRRPSVGRASARHPDVSENTAGGLKPALGDVDNFVGNVVENRSADKVGRASVRQAGALGSTAGGLKPALRDTDSGLLFLFDEPTTGLHFEDVAKLLGAFDKLLQAGHSLIVIEHNLDVIAASDWIIDLGPEGGDGGGAVVVEGPPEVVRAHESSHTGAALREYAEALARTRTSGLAPTGTPEPARTATSGLTRTRRSGLDRDRSGAEEEEQVAVKPAPTAAEARAQYRAVAAPAIEIRHAREHNLKNVSLQIPRDQFTVITGLSGSGKSTLAFDIVFGEGQRRYLESLNAYARQFVQPASRPDVDGLFGIPPTVAIEQRTSRGGRKSTVATLTEIHPFLRLMYVKLGTQFCPDCNVPVTPQSFEAIVAQIQRELRGASVEVLAPLVINRKGLYTDLAKWARGKGHTQLRVDGEYLPTAKWPRLDRYKEHNIELPTGMVVVQPEHEATLREFVRQALDIGKGVIKVLEIGKLGAAPITFSTLRACPSCGTGFPEPDPRLFSYNAKHGWCPKCYGTGLKTAARIEDPDALDLGDAEEVIVSDEPCPACDGARLNPVARAVRFRDLGLHQLAAQPVDKAAGFFADLALNERETDIARDLVSEIRGRLAFLQHVGLGYLALDRAAPTLSGGEAQRIRLAAQLGSNLRGVCYILDEPTIGLHPRDNRLLLDTLEALRDRGNTLLVVEHDEDTIRRADHVIDLGPGAGVRGGRVVAEGRIDDLLAAPESATGECFRHPLQHPLRPRRAVPDDHAVIRIEGATLHNLRDMSVRIPLARLTVVTGVSGSGKSSLARDVIHANLRARLGDPEATRARRRGQAQPDEVNQALVGCKGIHGWQQVGRVLEVDQTPIGKTPRSCPATYVGFWDAIRKLFADTFDARTRGWNASRFSFNTGAGRCPVCDGAGQTTVEMSFLPDVKTPCEACGGARFNPETLSVRWKEKTVAEVLAMPVDEAVDFFSAHPAIAHPLQLLQDVGLGYLTLGQPSPTLSGGEAQRIKLVTELAKVRRRPGDAEDTGGVPLPADKHSLYVLDEPTVGLHMADVDKLIHVLHRLTDAGHTVLVIEHDLDVMAEADWLIDLGPEGGDGGGQVVAEGPPEVAMATPASHTGRHLREFLAARTAVTSG